VGAPASVAILQLKHIFDAEARSKVHSGGWRHSDPGGISELRRCNFLVLNSTPREPDGRMRQAGDSNSNLDGSGATCCWLLVECAV
jgi:hypothetical protein